MLKKPYIIFDPEPFCFGPISINLSIVEYLRKFYPQFDAYNFVLLSTGTSLQLNEKNNLFDEIIECKTASYEDCMKNKQLINNASIYFSITNPNSIKNIKEFPVKKIYLDLLLWMWNSPEILPQDVSIFMAQYFYGVQQQCDRLKLTNINIIPPIFPVFDEKRSFVQSQNVVFVSYGGLNSVYFEMDSKFHIEITKIILKACNLFNKKLVIAAGGETCVLLKKYFLHEKNIEINYYGRKEFFEKIIESEKFICNAGIITYYDAISVDKNMFFLPPHNYSSYHQFNFIKKENPTISGLNYDKLVDNFIEVHPYLPEEIGIEKVKENMNLFLESSNAQLKLFQEIFLYLKEDNNIDIVPKNIFSTVNGLEIIGKKMTELLEAA